MAGEEKATARWRATPTRKRKEVGGGGRGGGGGGGGAVGKGVGRPVGRLQSTGLLRRRWSQRCRITGE